VTSLPKITGRKLINLLQKSGFKLSEAKGVISFLKTLMKKSRLSPFTQEKLLARDFSKKFFTIAISPEMN